ncbi:hypothetical protein [Synoicihabitans lomoniglobus]|uniref:Lipoprotein n=1 Tax=Synoicihabitans lomoniglobus TaxID=2909285 RepID=A0AAE9ZY00_9BACT|nr:hypothetical protein [Opitutaceae bacterium LMO-M01]WED64643.1 hypothetical protein PXH66_20055 [Opitutaceae bacterium LMO-M01]
MKRHINIFVGVLAFISAFGCAKDPKVGNSNLNASDQIVEDPGSISDLERRFSLGILNGNWGEIYDILHPEYIRGYSRSLFVKKMSERDIVKYYVNFHHTFEFENGGYAVCRFSLNVIGSMDDHFLVLFLEKIDEKWRMVNLPIPGRPELNFMGVPNSIKGNWYETGGQPDGVNP